MSQEYLTRMLEIVREGGRIALEMLDDSQPRLKPDASVLTQADIAVSQMIRKKMQDILSQPGHILIDEEDQQSSRFFDEKALAENPYLWVIDPIDGTRAFSNRMPLFGVSIGLLRERRPWLGAVFFPALRELFFADGTQAFFVKEAFSSQEKRVPIKRIDQEITRQSVFFGNDAFWKEYEWNFTLCQMMMPSCAVMDFCWPAVGRGCGCMFNSYIWDFGGAWPIARAAGLDMRSLSTGKAVEQISLDLFQGQGMLSWRLRENYLLSSERNFAVIKAKGIHPKSFC